MAIIINDFPTGQMLPEQFSVYIRNERITNTPAPGVTEVHLPTNNSYVNNPGCYVACYRKEKGAYAVSYNIYVVGQVRIKGLYNSKADACQPFMQHNFNFSHSEKYNALCNQSFAACESSKCWAGGDTMGWYLQTHSLTEKK